MHVFSFCFHQVFFWDLVTEAGKSQVWEGLFQWIWDTKALARWRIKQELRSWEFNALTPKLNLLGEVLDSYVTTSLAQVEENRREAIVNLTDSQITYATWSWWATTLISWFPGAGLEGWKSEEKFHISWSHDASGATTGKGATQKCPLLPIALPQSRFCHQPRYVSITWFGLQTCPFMGLIVWVRAMLAPRRRRKMGRKGRGKTVQTFARFWNFFGKQDPSFPSPADNSYKESLTLNTTAFREEKVREDGNECCCSSLDPKQFPWTE